MGVVSTLEETNGLVQIGALLLGGAPAVGAGLQNKQALALLVGQGDPALVLQELLGVDAIRHRHHGKVGADGGLFRDVHLDAAAVLKALGVVAGQGQLRRLGEILLQLLNAVKVHRAGIRAGQGGHPAGAIPSQLIAKIIRQGLQGHIALHHGRTRRSTASLQSQLLGALDERDLVCVLLIGQSHLHRRVHRHLGTAAAVHIGGGLDLLAVQGDRNAVVCCVGRHTHGGQHGCAQSQRNGLFTKLFHKKPPLFRTLYAAVPSPFLFWPFAQKASLSAFYFDAFCRKYQIRVFHTPI